MNTVSTPSSSRLESLAFYILLATVILAPIAFLPTPYIALDSVKTAVIALGTLISAILYAIHAYKDRAVILPPRKIVWSGLLLAASLAISAWTSIHASKSFFGQGFELNTASFIMILLLAGLVAFTALQRHGERATILYVGMTVPFIILCILHGLRFLLGPEALSFGVLSSQTITLVGTWYDLAAYALVVVCITLPALMFLPLSRRIKIVYWILLVIALVLAFVINSVVVWTVGALTLLAFTLYTTAKKHRPAGGAVGSFMKRITWLPLVVCLIAALFAWKGVPLAAPTITKLNANYTTLTLPWQLTLGVDASVLQNSPLFGVGPNNFIKAYTAFKPLVINSTYAWSAEFSNAFSLFATMVATQGIVGIITWILFLVLLGTTYVHMLRKVQLDSHAGFLVTASVFSSFFLWLLAFVAIPSHALMFYALVATGVALGTAVKHDLLPSWHITRSSGGLARVALVPGLLVVLVAGILWGLVYTKDAIALAYFGSGIKSLTAEGDVASAASAFARAQRLNPSDIYLQAQAEASIARANQLISTASQNATSASSSQAVVDEVVATVNEGVTFAQAAVAFDPTNYYNYVSEARVSEFASSIRMEKAYENAVSSYTKAIQLNPLNPALYLNLAQLQASNNKLDDALQSLGGALQAKNNYLDAIFLLSQVSAAKGNLADAITAARVTVQINPNSPVLSFQLGLLEYNNRNYAAAAEALERAVTLQGDYANARYFLGLSYARLNRSADAIEQFSALADSNPDNAEVQLILNNLQAGKSPFADAQPPVTPAPEKRSTLPIKEKQSTR